MCGIQYMGEMSQPLNARSDITHRRTDVSPVAELFNSGAHSVLDMTVMELKYLPAMTHVYER